MAVSKKTIAIIDDEIEMRSMLNDFLKSEGYAIREFPNGKDALDALKDESSVDLVITDLNMPQMNGLEFTRSFKALHPEIPVILITAFGTIETAVEAMRSNAFDYLTKPFKLTEISVKVARALHVKGLQTENQNLKNEINNARSFSGIIGKSPGMHEVFDLIQRVSHATANVLISGESGTGKEQVARAIHKNGPRAAKPFVAINCTAIPETLMESELFGHAKGSFTGAHQRKRGLFEEAEGGTLFLDEIGDMDLSLQSKLLRVLQEKKIRAVGENTDQPIDVRIIAATHKDLKAAIKNGTFREDLYYRLSVIPIVIPPLRHRREDIPLLAEHFLRKFSLANGSKVKGFSAAAMAKIMEMTWEGNVRELENWVERAVVLARGANIEAEDLPAISENTVETFYGAAVQQFPTVEELEKRYMKFILEKTGGKKEKAAQILGINRRTLYRKEREYGFVQNSRESIIDSDEDRGDSEEHTPNLSMNN